MIVDKLCVFEYIITADNRSAPYPDAFFSNLDFSIVLNRVIYYDLFEKLIRIFFSVLFSEYIYIYIEKRPASIS